ncbi:MAG TPA: hypothetical protein PKC76_17465 [Saprospiraceae bacterium]|nr:hypothetical protein [Saprospiraceae bacterium]
MKALLKFCIVATVLVCAIQLYAQDDLNFYPDFASMPEHLGILTVDTSHPKLANSKPVYVFTKEDALWTARFVEGESGVKNEADGHAVIWAMLNRFGMLRHRNPGWSSFANFLRLYSTTLQPYFKNVNAAKRAIANDAEDPVRWAIKKTGGYYDGTDIPKVQYLRHLNIQKKEWKNINADTRKMVIAILRGETPNPGIGIATDFAGIHIYMRDTFRAKYKGKDIPEAEWIAYTENHATKKGWAWIGQKENLNQMKKNAFFIMNEFKGVSDNVIDIIPYKDF